MEPNIRPWVLHNRRQSFRQSFRPSFRQSFHWNRPGDRRLGRRTIRHCFRRTTHRCFRQTIRRCPPSHVVRHVLLGVLPSSWQFGETGLHDPRLHRHCWLPQKNHCCRQTRLNHKERFDLRYFRLSWHIRRKRLRSSLPMIRPQRLSQKSPPQQ